LRRGELLEAGTVAWNAIEGIMAVAAGVLASSVPLIGFGVDSFVETASAAPWEPAATSDQIPKSASGKILRRVLMAQDKPR
jgi:acyl-CoA synthetase (AMP-forming)/AMP-acid ligase II